MKQENKRAQPSFMQKGGLGAASAGGYGAPGGAGGAGGAVQYHPISSLHPYHSRWTIKARVTAKGDKRTWTNAKGEGSLFSVDLLDAQGGQIRATMFKDACEKFYDLFQENKVYSISKGQLKPANKKFSRLPNEYELTLNCQWTCVQQWLFFCLLPLFLLCADVCGCCHRVFSSSRCGCGSVGRRRVDRADQVRVRAHREHSEDGAQRLRRCTEAQAHEARKRTHKRTGQFAHVCGVSVCVMRVLLSRAGDWRVRDHWSHDEHHVEGWCGVEEALSDPAGQDAVPGGGDAVGGAGGEVQRGHDECRTVHHRHQVVQGQREAHAHMSRVECLQPAPGGSSLVYSLLLFLHFCRCPTSVVALCRLRSSPRCSPTPTTPMRTL